MDIRINLWGSEMDELDKLMAGVTDQAPSVGPVSVQSGAGVDELGKLMGDVPAYSPPTKPEVSLPSMITMPGAPDPQGAPVEASSELDTLMGAVPEGRQAGYLNTLGELFAGGVKRNLAQFEAMPYALQSLARGYQGDQIGAVMSAQEALNITNKAGDSQFDLGKIHNTEDFSYWLTEKLGENAATMGAMTLTGGVAGLGSKWLAQKALERALISQTSARALTVAGAAIPTYMLSTAMETAGTGQEIFGATGKIAPELSLGAGAAKGALELWAPMSIAKSFLLPGKELGKNFLTATTKTMFKEGSTELAQEAIDIAARKHMDPNYNFFASGVDNLLDLRHPGVARLAEAGAAGFFTGGIYGAPAAYAETKKTGVTEDGNPIQAPGERAFLPGDPSLKAQPEYVGKIAEALKLADSGLPEMEKGPITALMQLVGKPDQIKDVKQATAVGSPVDDLMGAGPLLRLESKNPVESVLRDMVDKAATRYVVKGPDGKYGSDVMTRTELELDNVVNYTQDIKPDYHKIDPGSLTAAGITARIHDIGKAGPEIDLNRVWFLPGVSQQEKAELMAEYTQMVKELTGTAATALQNTAGYKAIEDTFRPTYAELLNRGLRVVPTQGSGFYYSGPLAAERVDVMHTERDRLVGIYNPKNKSFSAFMPSFEPTFRPEHQANYRKTLTAQWAGIPVSLDLSKLKEGVDYTRVPDGSIVLLKEIDLSKVTPGVDIGPLTEGRSVVGDEAAATLARGKPYEGLKRTGVYSKYRENNPYGPYIGIAMELERALNKLAPSVDGILRSLDLDFSVQLQVSDVAPKGTNGSPAWIWLDGGIIAFDPKNWANFPFKNSTGSIELDVQTILMHELGHMVTSMYWQKMTPWQMQALVYAWEKANLARRMDSPDNSGRIGDARAFNPMAMQNPLSAYYLDFAEWLAEQFRRFAEVDPQTVNWTEQAIKGGSKLLDQFYTKWEEKVGKAGAINLRNPDYYFTALMQYFRKFGEERTTFRNAMAQQELYYFSDSIVENHTTFALAKQVQAAIASLKDAFPKNVSVLVSEQLEGVVAAGQIARGQTVRDYISNLPYIELAFHALPKTNIFGESRVTITHELMHVLEIMNLITKEEIVILDNAIKKGPDPLAGKAAAYAVQYRSQLQDYMSPEKVEEKVQYMLDQERRAFYLQSFANGEIAKSEESRAIMARLLEVIERIKNFIQGLGYQSRDDVLRAIFRGEMAQRAESMSRAEIKNALRHSDPEGLYQFEEYQFDKVENIGKYTVGVAYDGGDASTQEGKLSSKYISYIFFHPDGQQAGFVDLKNRMPKGFEIEMIETKHGGDGFTGMVFNNYVEKDLGIPMKLAGILLEDGFQQGKLFARKRMGFKGNELGQFYQAVQRKDGTVQYYSPNKTREMVGLWTRIVAMMQTPAGVKTVNDQFADVLKQMVQPGATNVKLEERMTQKRAIAILASWKAFEKRFPSEVWTSPALEQMFQLESNTARDGAHGAGVREAQDNVGRELLEAVDGPQPRKGLTALEMYQEKMERYKAQTAVEMGWNPRDVGAPSVRTLYMLDGFKNAWQNVEGSYHEKMGTNPARINKELAGQVKIMDRMNSFWKWGLTIKQLAQKNPHIAGLRDYVNHEDLMGQIMMRWVRRAEETARPWERLGAKQREAISKALFDFTEQKYRTAAEVAGKVNRLPSGWQQFLAGARPMGETLTIMQAAGVNPEGIRIIQRVANDFVDFLNEVELLRINELGKTFKDPATLQVAITKMQSEMAEFRAKPYFPMMRFGQFTTVVRDSASGKIIAAYAYDNQAQRDRAVADVRRAYPGDDITIGRASEAAAEFMGMPGPLLRLIREKMNSDPATALSKEQETWLQEYEVLNGPDTTFAKRWMPAEGVPGYSTDAFRAYAQYFMSGSRYISRLAKMDDLKAAILSVEATFARGGIANTAKRQMIVDYMNAHYRYIMEPGQDAGKLRAFTSFWFLGFSVTSAVLNLTQVPLVTIPYLGQQFGNVRAYGAFNMGINALKNVARLRQQKAGSGNPAFIKAREEAINQGIIDVGQAAELGAFAEGENLHRLLAGDKTQKMWRKISHAGMYMFGLAEHFNRELTFQMAWQLAFENPNAKRVAEIDSVYMDQINDLQARTGMTYKEAVSFLFAKETVERTQYSYNKSADPSFMRGRKKDLLIFFKYTQNTLFTMSHSGKGAAVHMILLYFAIYGLQGLPGSEDWNELVRLLAKKIFGKDMDIHGEARKFIRDLTRGSVFDKTGPDLFMHGISRYGMGFSLLNESYFPKFDVSSNGSMGRIVPGMAELFHGMATDKKWADVFAESAQKASGAAYGMVFPLMKYMMEPPGTMDSKKWEQLLPRFAKGFTKAYRHGFSPGAETDSTGAKLVGFDITDPGDAATVLTTALGFQPRKVTEVYEMMRATRDLMDTYQARRVLLYAQLDKAVKVNDVEGVIDVTKAMGAYNQEVIDGGYPTLALKTQQVLQSLKQRASGRMMQENFLARNRSQIPVTQKMMDLYPGIEPKRVK